MDTSSPLDQLTAYAALYRESLPLIEPVPAGTIRPFWSVLIPTFNPSEALLTETLHSLLQQDPGPEAMEILVVDDASTQFDPEPVVTRLGQGRIKFLRNPHTLGLAINWNACLQTATGHWIHFLHQDDTLLPGFYDRLRPPIEHNPDIGAAYCRVYGVNASGRITWTSSQDRPEAGIVEDYLERQARWNRVQVVGIVVRRSVYETIGGFNARLCYAPDWDMWKRIGVFSKVWFEPECLACYRHHADSTTNKLRRAGQALTDERRAIEFSRHYLPEHIYRLSTRFALLKNMQWASHSAQHSLKQGDLAGAFNQSLELSSTALHWLRLNLFG
ncbi:MAG TPA: glycosyltransferase [Acidobacteriota bacterium]|nr:glycosyltransferase [Acidobacteriota bacterium]HNB69904.1 glycosyltransferase [Acidobacteriota bacterium]HND20168.1 glycosyltransferase [Acidobacteriota bacterium]HNG92489.1 glycosyltransferase [Acidobacteriota bacterium]